MAAASKHAGRNAGKLIRVRQPRPRSGDNATMVSPAPPGSRVCRGLPFTLLLVLAMLLPGLPAIAGAAEQVVPEPVLEIFVHAACPHCKSAEHWLATDFARLHPEIPIVVRDIGIDDEARAALESLTAAAGAGPPGVPSFAYRGRLMIGFDADADPAARLAALLGSATEAPSAPAPGIDGGPWGKLDAEALGLPLFTIVVGLIDGFNPCAMWVLMFLLSMLVRLNDRRRMVLIAGTFVAASGAVYYAFMAAWLNVFLLVGMSNALRIGLALVALGMGALNTFEALRGASDYTLAIPAGVKPGLYARMRRVVRSERLLFALPAAAALAVVVNFIEFLCTAGLPALYTAVLAQQGLTPAAHYGYLALYIAAYMADDALMVGLAVFALSSAKLGSRGARVLKLLSGGVMLALGAVMLFAPGVLL